MYFVEKTRDISFFKQFDFLLFISVAILSIFGIVVLGSATHSMSNGARLMNVQMLSVILGMIAAVVLSAIDYKVFKSIGVIFYFISVILLIIVLYKGVGDKTWGSRSWLSIPVVGGFQPSEIAKITFILQISMFLERISESPKTRDIIKLVVYSAIPMALILKQPDYGMAAVFIFVLFVLLFIYGIRYKYILVTIGVMMLSTPLIWFFVLDKERKSRIIELLFPGADPLGSSYQLDRAQMAIGSGQLHGSGLYKGVQTQNGGVPVIQSDFIFTAIGEELGFLGAVAVIALIFIILLRCIYVARNSRDLYGSLIVVGLASMMGFNFIQNIGMCVGVLPVTGLPLPFISSGGSAMITNYMAIGIILSVSIRRKRAIFNSSQ